MFPTQRRSAFRLSLNDLLQTFPLALSGGLLCAVSVALIAPGIAAAQTLGELEAHGDVGKVLHAGKTAFDPAEGSYTVTGSGANMWFTADEMQFAWKKVSGDVALTADIDFLGAQGNKHRKAALVIRQSLDPDSAYADVARHGDGLTSLQYRATTGDVTREVETAVTAPHRVRIERRGDVVSVFVGDTSGPMHFSGATTRLLLSGPFYVGLAVCSHDKDTSETAIFKHLKIEPLPATASAGQLWSTLETVKVESSDRRVAYTVAGHFEAPNWTRDGNSLVFNQEGALYRFALDPEPYPSLSLPAMLAAVPAKIDTGQQVRANNDHGLSPDGTQLAISDETSGASRVYVLPLAGGPPRQITPAGPSYWHGWSPDGQRLAFTGQRAGEFDIYTIPVAGGPETRLTTAPGLDDGPDYSTDGQWIYFNSERTGHMQLWRMHPDGTDQQQLLSDEDNDWFPHPSPDGKWVVFLAYKPGVKGHPGGQIVQLRLLSLADHSVHPLASLYGGQGTINVPSWSPDSTRVAFVSYANLP